MTRCSPQTRMRSLAAAVAAAFSALPGALPVAVPPLVSLSVGLVSTMTAAQVHAKEARHQGFFACDFVGNTGYETFGGGFATCGGTANTDSFNTAYQTTLSGVNVLSNDTPNTMTVISFTNPSHGTANVTSEGSLTYVPANGYSGADSFSYIADDGAGNVSATVNITVGSWSVDDSFNTAYQTSLTSGNVLTNDIGGSMTVLSNSAASHGTASVNSNGTFTYEPNSGYSGADSFTYTADNGSGNTTATVNITVGTWVVNDTFSTAYQTSLSSGNVLTNDLAGNTMSVTSSTPPSHGAANVNSDGTFTYVPESDYSGADSFTYTAYKSDDHTTATATVNITVGSWAVNDNFTTPYQTALTSGNVLSNDLAGNSMSVSGFTNPSHGTANVQSDGTFTYTPANGFSGSDSFTYRAVRGVGYVAPEKTTFGGHFASPPPEETATVYVTVSAAPVVNNNNFTPPVTVLPTGGGTTTLTTGQSVTVTENGKDGTSINLPPPSTGTGGTNPGSNSVNITLPGTGTVGVSSNTNGTQLGVTKVTLPGATISVNTVTIDQGSASFTATEKGQAVAGLKNGIVVVSGSKDSQVTVDATGANATIGVKGSDTIVVPAGSSGVSGTKVDLPPPTASGGKAATVNLNIGGHELTIQSSQANTTMTFEMKNIGGVQTPVLAVTGNAQVSSSGEDKPLVSVAGNVIKSGKSSGGSHQICNTIIQASSDASSDVVHVVTCYIVLEAGTFSAISGGGNGFAALKDGVVWAGETAEFGKDGKVTGAYLGSKQGTTDAVGDDLVPGGNKFTTSGYNNTAFIPRLNGVALRLDGANLNEALFKVLNQTLGVTTPLTPGQTSQGVLNFQIGSEQVSVIPTRRIRVDTSRADGVSLSSEGGVEVASGGLVTIFAPSVGDPQVFAAKVKVAQALPGAISELRWNGTWKVTGGDGTSYIGRPAWQRRAQPNGIPFSAAKADNVTYNDGVYSQTLVPDFDDYTTLRATFAKELNDPNITVLPNMDGTATAKVNGKSYTLLPQWLLVKTADITGKPAWWAENGVIYIKNADGTAQGFTVK